MKIVDIAVKRPVTIAMFVMAVLLFGFVSLSKLSINLLPELSYPTLTIRTDYQGAAPGEVEQLVSKPVEEAIGVVKGVRRVKSVSKAGQSDVLLEFEWGTDMDLASLEVREKLDILRLPLDVERPVLLRFNPNLDPVIRFGLGIESEQTSILSIDELKALRSYAEDQLKLQLESVSGVASVQMGGGLENEIQVLFDQQRIGQLNISANDIVSRLRAENLNSAGGRIEDGNQEYLVRTLNQFESLDDMRNLFIATRNGRHIRLGDVAQVQDAYKERTSVTRFNGFEGVEVAIYKEGDANTVEVAENVMRRLKRVEAQLPQDYQLQVIYDQSTFISNAINEVKVAGIIGGILAMIVLYLFLQNVWPTVIISLSIPVSIVATFNLMNSNDISLNIMSLGGIALAIGLLVDNSIVVLENIDRMKKRGLSFAEAARRGTSEVSTAITASTLTTIAVFLPLAFVDGIAGQLFSDQALTVTFALAASLVVALTLIPMLASRQPGKSQQQDGENYQQRFGSRYKLGKFSEKSGIGKLLYIPRSIINTLVWFIGQIFKYLFLAISFVVVGLFTLVSAALALLFRPLAKIFNVFFAGIESAYKVALKTALSTRLLVLALVSGLSLVSLLLVPRLGMELIPSMSQGEFYVEVTLPTGAKLDNTDGVLEKLALFTQDLEGVERTYSLAGTGSLMNASPSQGGDYWGRLNVVMRPGAADQVEQVKSQMREYLAGVAGVDAQFDAPELFSFSTPLEIEIVGYNLTQLRMYGNQMAELLNSSPRYADVKSSLQAGHPELKVQFDHARLAQLGLDAPSVSQLVATKVGGEVASRYSMDDRKIDILVRANDGQRDSTADIAGMIVNPGGFPAVTLGSVADIQRSIGPSEINRADQQRVVVVSANVAEGDLSDAAAEAQQLINQLNLPGAMSARVAGQSEEMQQSFDSLMFALGLAIFLVYIVMASQFESLLHPFLILFTVPLACAGSVYGLFITGASVSVVVFIGLIMLAGIVVNNAIVLIDRINQLREAGAHKQDAIFDAAVSRLRPILMTTLTTTLGLLPMAFGVGEGAEIRTPMAITVIFGLGFATLLTLFFIPVLYSLFDKKVYRVEEASYEQA